LLYRVLCTKLIFIAYPNNPTGNTFDRTAIEKIITSTHALVVLDEAYYAYANDSFLNDIKKYSNLVLLRTVSKIGFAGLRLGLLIGAKDTVEQLDKLRLPYNINTLTLVSANFLLQKIFYFARYCLRLHSDIWLFFVHYSSF
jgi:histidinol-phosphate aminotransferase